MSLFLYCIVLTISFGERTINNISCIVAPKSLYDKSGHFNVFALTHGSISSATSVSASTACRAEYTAALCYL